jgi:hypothetical protein
MKFNSIDEIKVGDYVTFLKGFKIIEVTEIHADYNNYVKGVYVESGKTIKEHYSYFSPAPEKYTNTQTMKEQLYTWTDQSKIATSTHNNTIYGTKLAINSAGEYVLEIKGTGQIVTMDPQLLTEVIPYTFMAKSGSTEKHFIGTEGKVSVGDTLIQTSTATLKIWVVKQTDTKNKTAVKFTGRRIVTEKI